jgi:nucleotide-binding universal stress UspA family protein
MMKRIVVPLDGSALAERALAVAAKLARGNDGQLILIQVLSTTIDYGSPFIPDMAPLAIVENDREAQGYLTRLTELPMLSGLSVKTSVFADVPAQGILNAASEYGADIIVMTSHGRTGVNRWVFGSVAEHVARQAHLPVLILRRHELPFWAEGTELVESPETPGETRPPFRELRILVPLDGSRLAEKVLEPAAICALSLVRGVEEATSAPKGSVAAALHLALVVRPFDSVIANLPESLILGGAEKYLREAAEWVRSAHPAVNVTWEIGTSGDVAEYLITLLREDPDPARGHPNPATGEAHARPEDPPVANPNGPSYTLLAMATHGRTGIIRWVWGSITERVVQKTRLPLLLVRPAKPAGQIEPSREGS